MRRTIFSMGEQTVPGHWIGLRADRAGAKLRLLLPGYLPEVWAVTAADRCGSRRIFPASVRLSLLPGAFHLPDICRLVLVRFPFLALYVLWRAPLPMWTCCF